MAQLNGLNPSPRTISSLRLFLRQDVLPAPCKAYPQRLFSLNLESCHPGLVDPQKTARTKNDAQWAERLLHLASKIFKLVVSAARVCRHDCGQT